MLWKILIVLAAALATIYLMATGHVLSRVIQEGDKTYIVDQTGERWDVTEAKSIGFRPEGFQYGIGRNAFTPLDDSLLSGDTSSVPGNLRVIGISDGTNAQAYSVRKLWRHEIANSKIGSEPIVVGY